MNYIKSFFGKSKILTQEDIQEIEDIFQYYVDDSFIESINQHHRFPFVKIENDSSRYDVLNSGKNIVNFYIIDIGTSGIPPFTSPKDTQMVISLYAVNSEVAKQIISKFTKRISLFGYKSKVKDDLGIVSTKAGEYYGKHKKYIEGQYMSKEYKITITK
jgi:hypothetical protein